MIGSPTLDPLPKEKKKMTLRHAQKGRKLWIMSNVKKKKKVRDCVK